MQRVNWDDFRFVLAVAETGSVGAAARALGVNHATVLRRVSAFEEAQKVEIFARSAQGYAVRTEHLRVIEALRDAAQAIDGVGRTIRGAEAQVGGTLRLTSTDSLSVAVLPAILGRLAQSHPELSIRLRASNLALDLGKLDADLTVRPTETLPETLRGVEAGRLGFGVYARRDGEDDGLWLGLGAGLARSKAAVWLRDNVAPEQVRGGADSFVVLREMAAEGLGRSFLPCCLGDGDPRLMRLREAAPPMSVPLWVASHVEMSESPRLKAIRDALVDGLLEARQRLSGLSESRVA